MANQDEIIVKTKKQLQDAVTKKIKRIIVKGDLAEKVEKSYKLQKVSKITLTLLAGALASTPFTGPFGLAAAGAVATLTGLEIALIIAVSVIGFALILLIIKDYNKASFKAKKGDAEAELVLEKK